MKRSIKTITLIRILATASIAVFLLIILIGWNFRQLTFSEMEDKARTVADFVEITLITHMRAGTHEEKEIFKDNIEKISDVNNLRIIRAESVSKQFNLPLEKESFNDPVIQNVFNTKQSHFTYPSLFANKGNTLRVTIPYIASKKRSYVNCLQCHNVPSGTVLGAIDFTINIDEYKANSLHYLYIIIGILLLILISLLYVMFSIIDKHVKNPLSILVEDTKKSFEEHTYINIDDFNSLELEDVAKKINDFTSHIIEKNGELETKNTLLRALNEEITNTQYEFLTRIGNIAETRSQETANHVQRVAQYSYLLAKHYGLEERECQIIELASPLHDIGKVGIPDNILKKPDKLTPDEFEIMKTHAKLGYNIFKDSQKEILKAASIIAYEHHEKWDGTGYPRGIKGDSIHIYGRITSIADVFDALNSQRVYKKAWELPEILSLFQEEKGKHFDPMLIDIFMNNLDQFLHIRHTLKDESLAIA